MTTLFREGAIDYPDPSIAWQIVEKYGVTKMFTAPTALRMFMRYGEALPAKHDLTTLRVIACAGEPLNPEAWRWAQTHLAGDGKWGYVVDNWWQTELAVPRRYADHHADASRQSRPGAAGLRSRCRRYRWQACIARSEGRLILKRPFPQFMRTIWNNPARFEKDWQELPGCYITGDLATKDEDGYVCVIGRADDVLNVAGHRIGTAEVESALVSHPAVAEAAAIGIPDALKGEAIVGFVQLRAGHQASDALNAGLIEHVRREMGPIATPSVIKFVAALPKTRSGKIMRRLLKAQETGAEMEIFRRWSNKKSRPKAKVLPCIRKL